MSTILLNRTFDAFDAVTMHERFMLRVYNSGNAEGSNNNIEGLTNLTLMASTGIGLCTEDLAEKYQDLIALRCCA